MSCSCHSSYHDYTCRFTPKCEHCSARLDIGEDTLHTFDCPTHIRCPYCNIAETLPGSLHNFDCPKWYLSENQARINHLRNQIINRRFNVRLFDNLPHNIGVLDLQHLRTSDSSQECPICQEGVVDVKTKCGHYFHQKCLENWCKISKSCPMCRNKQFF